MTKTIDKKVKKNMNPFIAAVTGIIVGAGVVTAGVMSLRNKDNRRKVKKVISKVKTKSQDYLKKAKDFINEDSAKQNIVEVKPKKTITKKKIVKEIKK